MKIFNSDKTEELHDVDLALGYLIPDKIVSRHVDAVEEQGHYETIAEYENGGKDVEWVVDVKGIPAHDEYEDVQVYITYSEKELLQIELSSLEDWFVNYYDIQVKQYERCQRQDVEFDKDIGELDAQADVTAARISEIRNLLKSK